MFQIVILVWLSLLTIWLVLASASIKKLVRLLVEARVLKIKDPNPAANPLNPLLEAAADAVKSDDERNGDQNG